MSDIEQRVQRCTKLIKFISLNRMLDRLNETGLHAIIKTIQHLSAIKELRKHEEVESCGQFVTKIEGVSSLKVYEEPERIYDVMLAICESILDSRNEEEKDYLVRCMIDILKVFTRSQEETMMELGKRHRCDIDWISNRPALMTKLV